VQERAPEHGGNYPYRSAAKPRFRPATQGLEPFPTERDCRCRRPRPTHGEDRFEDAVEAFDQRRASETADEARTIS
jgi:hypothetical protein